MKKSLIMILLVLVLVFSFSGCNSAVRKGEDVVTGGTFEGYDAISGSDDVNLSDNWTLYTGSSKSSTAFSLDNDRLVIDTSDSGYASMHQTVQLKSGRYYKLSYKYTINSISEYSKSDDYNEIAGIYVTFDEADNFNRGLDENPVISSTTGNGDVNLYFKSSGLNKSTIAVNFGAETAPVSGKVTITYIKLVEVDYKTIVSEGGENDIKILQSTVYNVATTDNVAYIVVGAVLVAVLMYAAYVLLVRYLAEKNNLPSALAKLDAKPIAGMLIAIGSALLVRFVATLALSLNSANFITINMGYDASKLSSEASALVNSGGTVWFLKYNSTSAFEPLRLLLLALAGLPGKAFSEANDILIANTFFIRLFAIIADIIVIAIIYRAMYKRTGVISAVLASTLYGLLPLTFALSSVLTSWSSITVMLIVLTFYLILHKHNYFLVVLSYFAACMFSVWAIWLAPIIVMWSIKEFIKKKSLRIPIIVSTIGGFVAFYLISLPFTVCLGAQELGNTFSGFELYFNAILGGDYYTVNAFNFQALLGNNMATISTASLVIDIIFFAFAVVLAVITYIKSNNRLDLILIAAAYMVILYTFGARMHAEFLYIALALLFLYGVVSMDKRIIFTAAALATVLFVNVAYVYTYVEYGTTAPAFGYADGVAYTFSAFELILALYLIYLTYDITIENRTVLVAPLRMSWATLWGVRIRKIISAIGKFFAAIGFFFKTVFSKTPSQD